MGRIIAFLKKVGLKIADVFKKIGLFFWKHKIITSIILIIAILVTYLNITTGKKLKEIEAQNTNVTVERRDIEESISGSSVINAKDEYSVTPLVTGEILDAPFEEGDRVEKGDTLYVIDSSEMDISVKSADLAIEKAKRAYDDVRTAHGSQTADSTLKSAELAYEKAKNSYKDALISQEDLNVRPISSGTVRSVSVKAGQSINAGATIAEIYNSNDLELRVPFNADDTTYISVGQNAAVTLTNTGTVLSGTVTEISTSSQAQSGYMVTRNVKIAVPNPGALQAGETATAMIGSVACNDVGTFYNITDDIITAKASGTISSVNITEGDRVSASTVVATIHSDAVDSQVKTAKLSLEDAEQSYNRAKMQWQDDGTSSNIENARSAYEDALLAKDKLLKQLDDYTIKAPISGTVVTKNKKKGDKIEGGSSSMSSVSAASAASASSSASSSALAVIYDMSTLEISLDVDEIDVKNLRINQNASITADASDKEYTGIIENISVNGTVGTNGVTTYPVKIRIIDADEQLLPGMNCEANIVISSVKNVVAIPVDALNRGDIVYVKGDKEDANDQAPDGFKSVEVKTGLSDNSYIEIKSGISDGDVIYRKLETTNAMEMMMGGGMGGGPSEGGPGGGGAPGGGM